MNRKPFNARLDQRTTVLLNELSDSTGRSKGEIIDEAIMMLHLMLDNPDPKSISELFKYTYRRLEIYKNETNN